MAIAILLVSSLLFLAPPSKQEDSTESIISKTVDQLVDCMTQNSDQQAAAFAKFEKMGERAVPFIVSHLHDMRKLPNPQISFINREPKSFEGRTYYGAEVVHDALSAILRQMTNQDIGAFDAESLATERQSLRQRNSLKWLRWCRSQYQDRSSACGKE